MESGAVDCNVLREGRVKAFHGVDCSEETFRRFREWLEPRKPVVFVSDENQTVRVWRRMHDAVAAIR